jgi:hypothetical protein
MSLDMTMGAREAALDSAADEADAAPVPRLWLKEFFVVTATAFSVLLSSTLGLLLYLR